MKSGIELIAEERQEQIAKHGWTIEHDTFVNKEYQLCHAATILLRTPDEESPIELLLEMGKLSNWNKDVLSRMDAKPYKDRLIIAGALIAAELDRLNNELKNQE